MKRALLAALAILCAANPARADFTGNDLKSYCACPLQSPSGGLCMGYFAGALDSMRVFNRVAMGGQLICEPPGVTGDQLVVIAKKYIADHPNSLKDQAASLIITAVSDAFPCHKK
jgi:hypothetical protein